MQKPSRVSAQITFRSKRMGKSASVSLGFKYNIIVFRANIRDPVTAYDQANCNGTSPGRAIAFNDIDPTNINCKPGLFRAAPQLLAISYKVTCP
jgi:hypothetical protein